MSAQRKYAPENYLLLQEKPILSRKEEIESLGHLRELRFSYERALINIPEAVGVARSICLHPRLNSDFFPTRFRISEPSQEPCPALAWRELRAGER